LKQPNPVHPRVFKRSSLSALVRHATALALPAVVLGWLTVGCRHTPRPAALTVALASGAVPPPVVLAELPLTTEASWQPLLESLTLLGGEEEKADLLGTLAAELRRDDLAKVPAARRLCIEAVYALVQRPDFSARFDAVRKLVDNLHAAAPSSPEARFARAFLRLVLLSDGQGGLTTEGIEVRILSDLQVDLAGLARDYPTFAGPGEYTPAFLAQRSAQVAGLLAGLPVGPAGAATPAAAPAEPTPTGAGTVP